MEEADVIGALLGVLLAASPAVVREYALENARAVDGDTVAGTAVTRVDVALPNGPLVWFAKQAVNVRIARVDAPEIRGKCASERAGAKKATATLDELLACGSAVLVVAGRDKYGRTLGDVKTACAKDGVAVELIRRGVVRAYDGGKRAAWCNE